MCSVLFILVFLCFLAGCIYCLFDRTICLSLLGGGGVFFKMVFGCLFLDCVLPSLFVVAFLVGVLLLL